MYYNGRRPVPAPPADGDRPPGGLRAPALYARLRRAFGPVWVGNRGEPFRWQPLAGPDGIRRTRVLHGGEIYRWQCPYCGDSRRPGRGWASHYFGQGDPLTGSPMFSLAGCLNENCLREPGNRDDFVLRLLGVLGQGGRLPPCEPGEAGPPRRGVVSLPGVTASLLELPDDHPARLYLAGRGFDPGELAAAYGLGYCLDAEDHEGYAVGRLIIPIRMGGRLVGWQARKLGESGAAKKYYNSHGSKGAILYGHDEAAEGRLAVLVEGVPGVWALGPPAMAAMGKVLSPGQCERLAPIGARGGLAVVLLDPGAERDAAEAAARLEPYFPGRVVVAGMPASVSPGDCRRWPIPKLDVAELRRPVAEALLVRAIEAAGHRPGDYGFPTGG